jgi:predicted ATPase/class 3 adenylate cyclase
LGKLPTGTVTFLFTDLERSTALWEQQTGSMHAALARHDELLASAIAAGGGHVIKGTGDGVHAVFAIAPAAVAAAVAAQLALEAESWGTVSPLRARMGLHTGVAEQRGDDYYGRVLNEAARLMDAGHGGQILVSRTTWELVRDALPEGCQLIDLGEHRLRGVSRPMGVGQVAHPGLPRRFPPLRLPDTPGQDLPVQLTSFVGRRAELEALERLLAEVRLLTLTGSGGCGKTRLGLELARRVSESRQQSAWFVDLAPVSDARAVPSAIAGALGLRDDGRRTLDQIVGYLQDRDSILVVDNCEHVIAAAAEAAGALVTECTTVTVIATSREPLGVGGETPWRVPRLSVPGRGRRNPRELREFEAVRLFVERAVKANPSFAFSAENALDIAEVCARLDGIPLAIELAAARVRMLSVRQIREGLSDRFHLLTGGARTAVPRHQTLRASVDWSVDLLGDGERRLLARLSVFSGGFTLDAARGVATGGSVRDDEVLDLLTGLVDRSLVQTDDDPSVVRYHLLETIREHAAEQLLVAGEVDAVRDRHAAFFLALAETAEPHLEGRDHVHWTALLEHERANLRTAVHWAAARHDGETAQRLSAALIWFFVISGHLREAKQLFDVAFDTPRASPATRARALQARAYLGWHRFEHAEAAVMAAEATELARDVGDRRTEARALCVSAMTTLEYDQRLSGLEASIAVARDAADLWCLAHGLSQAGQDCFVVGDNEKSQLLLRECVAVCEAMGDTYIVNTSRVSLARSLLIAGDYAGGKAMLETVIEAGRESGDTYSLPSALAILGTEMALRGDEELGLAYLDESAMIARRGGLARTGHLAGALERKAFVLLLTGRSTAARPIFDEVAGLTARPVLAELRTAAFAGLAMVDALEGDLATAEARVREARAARPANAHSRSVVNMADGEIARARGDLDTALSFLQRALKHAPRDADGPAMSLKITILEMLVRVLLASGKTRDGVLLLAATHAGRVHRLVPAPQSTHNHSEEALAAARALLGAAETDRAWAEGLAMTIADAIAFGQDQRA